MIIKQFILFFLMATFSLNVMAGPKCKKEKENTNKQCSPAQLEAIQKKMNATDVTGNGTAQAYQRAKENEEEVEKGAGKLHADCEAAIKKCSDACLDEAKQANSRAQQARAQQPVPDEATAQREDADERESNEAENYCTKREPKKVSEAAKNTQKQAGMDIGKLLQALAQLMAQKKGEEPQKQQQDQSCNGAKAGTDACISKASNISSDFASGTARQGEGSLRGQEGQLGTAEASKGNPAKLEYAKGFGGGGGAGGGLGGFGSGGMSAASSGKGKEDPKDPSRINFGAGGASGGGGSRGGAGGGGGSGAYNNANNAPSSRSSENADKQVFQTAEKAMQQRGLASDGPLGGITAAHSFDNFIKVEKRLQAERNGLREH